MYNISVSKYIVSQNILFHFEVSTNCFLQHIALIWQCFNQMNKTVRQGNAITKYIFQIHGDVTTFHSTLIFIRHNADTLYPTNGSREACLTNRGLVQRIWLEKKCRGTRLTIYRETYT